MRANRYAQRQALSLSPPPVVTRRMHPDLAPKDPNSQLLERLEELEKQLSTLTTQNAKLETQNAELQSHNNAHEKIREILLTRVAVDNETTAQEVEAALAEQWK